MLSHLDVLEVGLVSNIVLYAEAQNSSKQIRTSFAVVYLPSLKEEAQL